MSKCSLPVILLGLAVVTGGCSKQVKRARYMARANQEFAAGQYDRAEIDYLRVIRLPPPEPLAMARLGTIFYEQGKRLQALGFLQEGVKANPADIDLRIRLGQTYLWFRQIEQARAEAMAVLQHQRDHAEALILLADAAVNAQQFQQTEQLLLQMAPTTTNRAGWHLAQATLYCRQAQLDKAESEYRAALELDPKSSAGYLGLGELYVLKQDLKQAEPALKTAADLAPLRSYARLRYAELKQAMGAYQEAENTIQELSRKAPDYVPALGFLAQLALNQGKTADCAGLIQKILALDPLSYEGLLLNGKLMLTTGNGTNAAVQFERVVKAYGPGAQAEYYLALAQLLNRQDTKAMGSLERAIAADTNFVDAIALQANLNLRKGNPDAAVVALNRLVQQQIKNPELHLLLAKAYLVDHKPAEAIAVYQRMQQLFPTNSDVPFMLGTLFALQNKRAEARPAFEKTLQLAPGYLPAVEQLVDLDLRENHEAAAQARAEQQCHATPNAGLAWVLLAKVHMAKALVAAGNQGEAGGAKGFHLDKAAAAKDDLSRAETALRKAIDLDPALPTACEMLARLYVWSNRQQKAIEQLETLVARTNNVEALNQIGMIQSQLTNYTAARDAYERALKIDPNSFEALNNLAYVQAEHLDQLQQAFDLAEQARRLAPRSPFAADTLGWVCFRRGEYPRASALLQESASARPGDPEMQYHLGMSLYMRAEEGPARAALERAVRSQQDLNGKTEAAECLARLMVDPGQVDPTAAADLERRLRQVPNDPVALLRLADYQIRTGEGQKAAAALEAVLKINPQNAASAFRLAQLYERDLKDPQRALALARQAHEIAPDDVRTTHLLGRLAYATSDYKWAADLLQTAVHQAPNDPGLLYDLAWSYYSLGQVDEAQKNMQSAVVLPLESARGEDAKRFLELVAACREPAKAVGAVGQAQAILASQADYVPALMALALAEEQSSAFKEAAHGYERILNRFPQFAPAARNLALLCAARLGNEQRAYELATQARSTYPDDTALAKSLGILCYKRGEFPRAVQLLEQSALSHNDDGEALCYLGMSYCQVRQPAQGKLTLQKALALSLPPTLADQAKSALGRL